MKYPTESDILAIKEAEQIKLKRHTGHLPLIIGIGLLAFLFFCVLPYFMPRGDPAATPPPAAIAAPMLDTAAPTASPFPTATASPTYLPTWTMWPTETPVLAAPAVPATAVIPAAYTPLPTHTAAPTYTPPPTWTPQATWTPAPTWTPQATQTPQNTPLPLIVTRQVTIPPVATGAESDPLPGGLLVVAIALGGVAILIGLSAALRRPAVQPAPIIIQQAAPAALPSPSPGRTPLFLVRDEPDEVVTAVPEVEPVKPLVKPPVTTQETAETGSNGAGRPGMIRVGVAPAPEVSEATMRAICAVWNKTKDPSLRKVCFAYFGSRNDTRHAIVRQSIQWGREQQIIQPRRASA